MSMDKQEFVKMMDFFDDNIDCRECMASTGTECFNMYKKGFCKRFGGK